MSGLWDGHRSPVLPGVVRPKPREEAFSFSAESIIGGRHWGRRSTSAVVYADHSYDGNGRTAS